MTTPHDKISEPLKECPFCAAEMIDRDGSYKHPNNECFLCAMVIFPPQYKEWNTRAATTPAAVVTVDAFLSYVQEFYDRDWEFRADVFKSFMEKYAGRAIIITDNEKE